MTIRARDHRLRSALFLSIADVFIGSATILLILVVFSNAPTDPLIPRSLDSFIRCVTGQSKGYVLIPITRKFASALVSGENSPRDQPKPTTLSIDQWLAAVSSDKFLLKVGVIVDQGNLLCFTKLKKQVSVRNRALSVRGVIATALALTVLPERKGP